VPGGKLDDHFAIGDWVRARILRIEQDEKKVGLTLRGVTQPSEAEIEELNAQVAAHMEQTESEESGEA